jgi:hypothetical protein
MANFLSPLEAAMVVVLDAFTAYVPSKLVIFNVNAAAEFWDVVPSDGDQFTGAVRLPLTRPRSAYALDLGRELAPRKTS